jgi:hypothetical protein
VVVVVVVIAAAAAAMVRVRESREGWAEMAAVDGRGTSDAHHLRKGSSPSWYS